MPVLYGVFLYMGVSSLKGIQVMYNLDFTVTELLSLQDAYSLRHLNRYDTIFALITSTGVNQTKNVKVVLLPPHPSHFFKIVFPYYALS